MIWLFVGVAVVAVIVASLARWARTIPEAYAWDPNSHDKITCHAIELLQSEPSKTLLGWVLLLSRTTTQGKYFRRAIESQIRRGSVEEDMNSFLLRRELYTGAGVESFEGANGGYHFYNPSTAIQEDARGLSDLTVMLALFGQALSGAQSPMPSAVERAFLSPEARQDPGWCLFGLIDRNWHLDTEGRNYSVGDAVHYLTHGYPHLSFYTIGRVCHLLQDMAVPAHVRNDAHPGGFVQDYGADPSDPLEVYADARDEVGKGGGSIHKWAFDPDRSYPIDRNLSAEASATKGRVGVVSGKAEALRGLFHALATDTSSTCYSYNTVPGNGNSQTPDSPFTRPLPLSGAVDWTECWAKCAPSVDGVCEVLRKLVSDAAVAFSEKMIKFSMEAWLAEGELRTYQAKVEEAFKVFDSLPVSRKPYADIIGICPTLEPSVEQLGRIVDLIIDLHDGLQIVSNYLDAEVRGNPLGMVLFADPDVQTKRMAIGNFLDRYNQLRIELLAFSISPLNPRLGRGRGIVIPFGGALPPGLPTLHLTTRAAEDGVSTILKNWIEAHDQKEELTAGFVTHDPGFERRAYARFLDQAKQGSLFTNMKNRFGPFINTQRINGPFCLTEEIIRKQWQERQGRGVGYTASLLSSWYQGVFEEQDGLTAWLNKDPGDDGTKPTLTPLKVVARGGSALETTKVGLIGIANNLPLPLDLTIEIAIDSEGTDPDVLESGVELGLDWSHLRPASVVSTTPAADHFLLSELAAYVSNSGGANAWTVEALSAMTLGDNPKKPDLKKTDRRDLIGADPGHLEAMLRMPLARGRWSQQATDMGGITRDVEANAAQFPALELPTAEGQGSADRLSVSFLRIVPRLKAETETPSPPPGAGPAGAPGSGS